MIRLRHLCFALIGVLLLFSKSLSGQNQGEKDILLQTLKEECDNNFAELKKLDPPAYILTYRLEENHSYKISSLFNVINQSDEEHKRVVTIQVRVGSMTMDNFREIRSGYVYFGDQEYKIRIPVTEEIAALKQILRRETGLAYQQAASQYQQVKSNSVLLVELEDSSPDFTESLLESYYEPPISNTSFNMELWKGKLRSYSEKLFPFQDITSAQASINYTLARKYYVSSEGNSIVQNQSSTYLSIYIDGKAEDGMNIPVYHSWFAFDPISLPSNEVVEEKIIELKELFLNLRTAPSLESFSGPALLSNDAAAVFFHELFGHRVEGSRLKSERDGQTFKKKVGEQILNPHINITFDPTLQFYKGIPLSGSYIFDEEGIRGCRVEVIKEGVLNSFLMSRTPIDGFEYSNGHARAEAGMQPVSRQSNMIVESDENYTDTQLREQLRQELIKQNIEFGIYLKSVTGGYTLTSREIPNAFKITPIEVYQVFADGRPDQLVRGVSLIGTPLAMLSQIKAVGDTPAVFSGICIAESGAVPVSCVSPALFVQQIELQKQNKSQEKPPVIQRPTEKIKYPTSEQNQIFKALEEEIDRNRIELYIPGLPSPYYISYLMADAKFISVKASLGGIIYAKEMQKNSIESQLLVGSHKLNNLNYFDIQNRSNSGTCFAIPEEIEYSAIRNGIWKGTDQQYKKVAARWEAKKNKLAQQNKESHPPQLPDFYPTLIADTTSGGAKETFSQAQMENIAVQLSALFKEYPSIINSTVSLHAISADLYYLNSEKVQFRQPYSLISLRVFAETQTESGEYLNDHFQLLFNKSGVIPTLDSLKKVTLQLADNLDKLRKAPLFEGIYQGPVLIMDDAVGTLFNHSFVENENGILAGRKPFLGIDEQTKWLLSYLPKENQNEQLINKRIISKYLNLLAVDHLESYNHTPLIGHFKIDAEGNLPSPTLPLIEKGVIKQFLSDRIPTSSSIASTGHHRIGFSLNRVSTALAPGVLWLKGENKYRFNRSRAQLKKQLIKMAKEEGYQFAYIITKLPYMHDRDFQTSGNLGDGKTTPIYIYQVNVKDGSEQLIRGVSLPPFSVQSFKQIEAVEKEYQVFNRVTSGREQSFFGYDEFQLVGIPVSYILPKALLFKNIEIKKQEQLIPPQPSVLPYTSE